KRDFITSYSVKPATLERLRQLQHTVRAKGAELVIAYPPVRGLVHIEDIPDGTRKAYGMQDAPRLWQGYEFFIRALREEKINIVGLDRHAAPKDFYYKRDHHWSASGARAMAREIAAFIAAAPAYKTLEKQD